MRAQYYQTGTGASANVFRVLMEGNIPVEYAYLDQETGQWLEHAAVVDRVTQEPSVVRISLKRAKEIVFMREAAEPEWVEELES